MFEGYTRIDKSDDVRKRICDSFTEPVVLFNKFLIRQDNYDNF